MSENKNLKPLLQRKDIIVFVDSFYSKVKEDTLIGPIFTEQAQVNWDEHMPKLYNFWEDLLFGTDQYHGRPFPPHITLKLKAEHFERWLKLFMETIDENFYGDKAEEVKWRALRIARNFMINLGLLSPTAPQA